MKNRNQQLKPHVVATVAEPQILERDIIFEPERVPPRPPSSPVAPVACLVRRMPLMSLPLHPPPPHCSPAASCLLHSLYRKHCSCSGCCMESYKGTEIEFQPVELLGTCVIAGCMDREQKKDASSFVICSRSTRSSLSGTLATAEVVSVAWTTP
jgi:hypothetical protein